MPRPEFYRQGGWHPQKARGWPVALSWPLIQLAVSSPVSFHTSVPQGLCIQSPLLSEFLSPPLFVHSSTGPSYHWGPLRSALPFTGCVKPGEGPLCSAADEGHSCLGVEMPGRRASSHPPPSPGFPLQGLSSPSWPSWPRGTVSSAKTKQKSKGNF